MVCPSANQLRRLLDDDLGCDESSVVVSHVAECAECQHQLDEWTSSREQPATALTPTEPGLLELIERLRERPIEAWSAMTELSGSGGCVRFAGPVSEVAPLGWLGAYQIERELGSGTTGQVFAARDSRLGRRVAIKVLRPHWASHAAARSRFEREARAVAALEDERIVKVFEVGETSDGSPYIVMEFVDGESLDARWKRDRTVTPRESAAIARQIALGLDAAHRRGIVHRDVKPSNIVLVSSSDSNAAPAIKLADFGLARVPEATESLTQDGFIAGTPAYMSPEQIRRPQDADARSDVYSVGVLLYEMLTGERPFRGVVRMVLYQALHEEPVPPRRLNDRVPRDLETICLKAMSKEPPRRYSTAAELADDLQRWLNGQTVLARPVGPIHRVWRWCRRNPKLAALNGVVAAVLLAGSVDVVRYALPPEHWPRDVAAARQDAVRWRHEAEQLRLELQQLAQAMVFEAQDSDGREALEAALRSLDSIPNARRDESVRQMIAVAHGRLSDLLAQNGKPSEALPHLQAALKLMRELAAEKSDRRDWKLESALLRVRLAELSQQLGHESDTEQIVSKCLSELAAIERDATDPAEASDIAHARIRLAETLSRLGRTDDARRQLRLICDSLGRIASRPESTSRQLREALAAVGRLANELLDREEFTEAFAVLDPAVAWGERLIDAADVTSTDQQSAVLLFRNLALVERRLDRRAEAERHLEQLDQILSRLEAEDRMFPQAGRRDWLTLQRRELTELQSAVSK